jgi:metallo-beta-lactamase class B
MENHLTEDLVRYIEQSLRAEVSIAVPGHFHDDCLSGLPYLHSKGARSIAGKKTIAICRDKGLVVPQQGFRKKKKLKFGYTRVELRYFGGGHAPDNIVVWFPQQKVLFGGCLIRPLASNGLGNTGDAVLDAWGPTVEKIQKALPGIKTVVPGHGPVGDAALLQHTIDLATRNP